MVIIDRTDGVGAARHRDAVFTLYNAVFGAADPLRWTAEIWDRHRSRPDFRLVTATEDDGLLGFGWGYTGRFGQYWTDLMAGALGAMAPDWIDGHFEVVELAVSATARGRGIGGRLHDGLLDGLPHRTAMLSTSTEPGNPAIALYRSRGWRVLGLLGEDVQMMGLRNPGLR